MLSRVYSFLFFILSFFLVDPLLGSQKQYVNPQELLESSFALSKKIYDSGFRPTVLISLWRGGAPIGIAITDFFSCKGEGIQSHGAIRTSSYHQNKKQSIVQLFGLDDVAQRITKNDRVLIVDDLVDSGQSVQTVLDALKQLCGDQFPGHQNVKVATLYYKPKTSSVKPDFYLHQTDAWLVFPHEIHGLNQYEIVQFQGKRIAQMVK